VAKKLEKQEIVMEDRDGRQDERILLTQEEESSLTLLDHFSPAIETSSLKFCPVISGANQTGPRCCRASLPPRV